jgi:hypothetical protein
MRISENRTTLAYELNELSTSVSLLKVPLMEGIKAIAEEERMRGLE